MVGASCLVGVEAIHHAQQGGHRRDHSRVLNRSAEEDDRSPPAPHPDHAGDTLRPRATVRGGGDLRDAVLQRAWAGPGAGGALGASAARRFDDFQRLRQRRGIWYRVS